MPHVPTACDQCGQTDDHPKLHYGAETFHHDCTPARIRAEVPPRVVEIIEAAEGGTRGDKLRAHIAKLHKES